MSGPTNFFFFNPRKISFRKHKNGVEKCELVPVEVDQLYHKHTHNLGNLQHTLHLHLVWKDTRCNGAAKETVACALILFVFDRRVTTDSGGAVVATALSVC